LFGLTEGVIDAVQTSVGTPLSAYCKYLSPLIEEIQTVLPENTPLVLLSTTNLLASSPPPSSPLWTALSSHLIRLIPPYEPPPPLEHLNPQKSTIKGLSKPVNEANMDVIANGGLPGGHSTMDILGLSSVKRWTDFLTFNGRSRPPIPRNAQDVVSQRPLEIHNKETQDEGRPQKEPPTPTRPDVDQQSLEEAMSSLHVLPQDVSQGGPPDSNAPKVDTEAPHDSMLFPALEYLANATSGMFGVYHPSKLMPSDKPSGAEGASQEIKDDHGAVFQGPGSSNPVVDIVEVGGEANGDEDTKTETSHKGEEDPTAAEQSLHKSLSISVSPNPTPNEQRTERPPSTETAPKGFSESVEKREESTTSRVSSRRPSVASSKPTVPTPLPESFFVPLSVYLEDEKAKELRLRRVYHMSVREQHEIAYKHDPFSVTRDNACSDYTDIRHTRIAYRYEHALLSTIRNHRRGGGLGGSRVSSIHRSSARVGIQNCRNFAEGKTDSR